MSTSNEIHWKNLLRQERIGRNWRQRDLAEQLETTVLTIQRWERGSHLPSAYFRVKLCALFHKSPEELKFISNNPSSSPLRETTPGVSLEAPSLSQEDVSTIGIRSHAPELMASSKIWNLPYPRNPFFLGRDDDLLQLHSLLQSGQIIALSGLGGIGKTQLAMEYAYQYHQDYQAVLWARAESTDELVSSYITLATLLQLPERDEKELGHIIEAIKMWLQTHRNWLLILDNADELAWLPHFLPPLLGGHLLLTTRATATGRLAYRLEIKTLSPEDSALFLLRRAILIAPDATIAHATQEEQELALQISQELGGLPLALDQAGAYLEETGMDLLGYWQLYQKYRTNLLGERRGLVSDHPAPIATTWTLSFQRVEEQSPAAADVLRLCIYLSPDAIPEEILTADASRPGSLPVSEAADALQFNQNIEALRAYSLLQRDPKRKMLSIHRLVQAVFQDTLEEWERHLWSGRAVRAVNAAFPDAHYDTWQLCERLLPQALFAAQLIETHQILGKEAGRLLYQTASYLRQRVRYQEAELLYLRVLHIWEQQPEPEYPEGIHSLSGLAEIYREQGKYAQAELLYLRVLHIWEQQLGPEHLQVTYPLNGLAILYWNLGKYTEAEPLYQRALHIRELQLGPEHFLVAVSLNGLAEIYREQGKYTEAELLYQRALHICKQQPEHPQAAYPLNNLAELYREQGKYAEAEPLYQRALHIWEQQFGPECPQVAHPLNNLGELYRGQNKYAEAESCYQRALRIWELQNGLKHPLVAHPLNGLAELYREQGKYAEAEPLYQRALHIREQQLGLNHPDTAKTMQNLIKLRELLG